MKQPILIRKYVNRRLYDTAQSRYVNLEDLRKIIVGGANIKVVEQATGDDISTTVLLQIIGDAQRTGARVLNAEFLSSAIRLSASPSDPSLPDRLNDALQNVARASARSEAISAGNRPTFSTHLT